MTKRVISVFFALLMSCSMLTFSAFAEETTEPSTEVSYVTYKLSEIISSLDSDSPIVFQPTDIIEIDEDIVSKHLRFVYSIDKKDDAKAYSPAGYSLFWDIDKTTGYAVKAIGDIVDYADRITDKSKPIDYVSEKEYAFIGWKVVSVYSKENFNEIRVAAVWDIPEPATGWDGFMVVFKDYLERFLDYLISRIIDVSTKLGAWFG